MLDFTKIKITSVPCRVCGRPLRSARTIANGVGDVCSGKRRRTGRSRKSDCQTIDMFEQLKKRESDA